MMRAARHVAAVPLDLHVQGPMGDVPNQETGHGLMALT